MGALPARLRIAFERGGEMGRRMAALDWSGSPAGDPSAWPPELVDAVVTMLRSRAQIVIFWGPEYATLYNDAYAPTTGGKHPAHLGRPGHEMWAETWSMIEGLFRRVHESDEAFYDDDHLFMIERFGFIEETYFDISYDPIRAEDGSIGGIMCIVAETTGRVLAERRARTLSALGRRLADAPDLADPGPLSARELSLPIDAVGALVVEVTRASPWTTTTGTSWSSRRRRSPGRWRTCGPTSRSVAGPPSWPRWTGRRPPSSRTSATSSVPP